MAIGREFIVTILVGEISVSEVNEMEMKIREWTANFEDTKTRTDARNSALADAGKHLHKRLVRCNSGYRLRRLREKKEEQLLPQQRHLTQAHQTCVSNVFAAVAMSPE